MASRPVTVWIDQECRGRWAVLVGGGVLIRVRQRSEARALARASADEANHYKCVVRRWKREPNG